ncbi:hypothetical protein BS78_06G048500 [Paspalum vaginatum]|nr:hypothetical protein BS78_06G048500 [Paspalum vaginatum]
MKGGRLHRPEPQQIHLATAASVPAPNPADDWVDGSWTVDCSCGVTFDDGEEMVSCDECSVWVHTRCARYVRGVHTSFSCHKCRRSKRAPSSADEAEVAELLAELPTHRPPPLYRRWAEVPLPARVHVHGLPGGGDAALFRGAPAFSAALWRCTGYVPKRFGFRYCEFPSWADDNDGADALFALARDKPRDMNTVPIVVEPKKEKHYVRSLSCRGKKVDCDQQAVVPPVESKKREPDSWKDRYQHSEDHVMQDARPEDHQAERNMANSDLQTAQMLSVEKKNSEQVPEMLSKDGKKVPLKLEVSSGIRTASSMMEQEVHSGLMGVEVTMYKQHSEGDHNVGLRSGIERSGPITVQDRQGLQKQPNETSNLQGVVGAPDLQIGQSNSQIIKTEPSLENEMADSIQLASDDYESNKQGIGDAAGFPIVQTDSYKLAYDSICHQHPKSEAQNLMHTVAEDPNSTLGPAKVCTSFSGAISIPHELSRSLAYREPSSAGNSDSSKKEELVSPTDIKHDSAKFSEDSSQEVSRCPEKVQLKGSLLSAQKSSQASRIHVSTVKPKLQASKEQSQKVITGGTSSRSFHGEVPPMQSRHKAVPSSKAVASSSFQKKDKHHRIINVTQDNSNNLASTSDSTAPLSDEQLALLLHQQLNSSPRVPRVPRCHQAAGAQMLHPTGATIFSKRSSTYGGRDHAAVLKKRNREDSLKDSEDTKRTEKRRRDSGTEHASSVKDSCRSAENIASEQKNRGICSTGASTGLAKDDLVDSSVAHNLSGLIDEIIGKDKNITYGELSDAIHQHFRDSKKFNGGYHVYGSYLHAINDCLRKRKEWTHLIDQASKMNSNKRRKGEGNSPLADVLEAENMRNGPERDSEGSADLHQEGMPRDKRTCWKRRRLELKGRRVRDTRKISSIDSSSEDAAATLSDSNSDRYNIPMDDVNEADNSVAPETGGYVEAKSADSSS